MWHEALNTESYMKGYDDAYEGKAYNHEVGDYYEVGYFDGVADRKMKKGW